MVLFRKQLTYLYFHDQVSNICIFTLYKLENELYHAAKLDFLYIFLHTLLEWSNATIQKKVKTL